MVIICQQCTARLQLDDSKVPARAFTVRCPKCQHIINAQPPAPNNDPSALGLADQPLSAQSRFGQPMAAPAYKPATDAVACAPAELEQPDVARLLAALLQKAIGPTAAEGTAGAGHAWGSGAVQRALVCATAEHRFAVARVLVENGYEVFIAEDTTQAIERMREDHMDVVLLAPDFDAQEQGAVFITRELSALRPSVRRRVFFIHFAPDVRTGDAHAALIRSANFVANPADTEDLPRVLTRALRDFNELYRDFNKALQLQGL